MEFGFCEGIRSPRARIAYFRAVQSRWSRHSSKLASLKVGRISRQVASKPARAPSKSTAVPFRIVARLHTWIEPATPFPLFDVDRAAGAARDRADLDVTIVDVPAILALRVASAGEGGHRPSFRRSTARANYQSLGAWNEAELPANAGVESRCISGSSGI
jgi:hypothetical protein